jgi:hypothetical protein
MDRLEDHSSVDGQTTGRYCSLRQYVAPLPAQQTRLTLGCPAFPSQSPKPLHIAQTIAALDGTNIF